MPSFTWGSNKSRTEHKALLTAAQLPPEGKEAAERDPSPCPPPATPSAPVTYAPVWFLQGSSTASCSRQRAHAAAADSKSPRHRASLHQILKWTLQHALPALVLPEFNTRKPPSQPLPCNLGSSTCSRVTHCRGCSALRFAGTRGCF